MHILLKLFLTFLEIGAVSFGGGYGMIALIREKVINNGWLTEEEFLQFIAVAESTPGPVAINMATFIGSNEAGFGGALLATLGVVLPSFVIILIIAAVLKNILKFAGVQWVLKGVRPVAMGLIVGTGITMVLSVLIGLKNIRSTISVDYKGIIIFAVISGVYLGYYFWKKKFISPIILILISAAMGILLYSIKGW